MTTATFDTSEGTFKVKLYDDKAPNTVANFVGLAEGTKEWTDPKTGQKVKRPFYDGLVFHRVIDGFMIQGGCPMGNGMGGPGYKFADEFGPGLRHDRSRPCCRWPTPAPTPTAASSSSRWRRRRGSTTSTRSSARSPKARTSSTKIGKTRTAAQDRPAKEIVINSVKIEKS